MLQVMDQAPGKLPDPSKRSPAFGISVLNVDRRTWERLPPVPDFPEGLPIFSRLVAVGGKLVVLGGWNPSTYETLQTVYIFNFVTHSWSRGRPMPTPRSFFASASLNNLIFVAGGHDNGKTALKSGELYNVDTDEWTPLPPMRYERDEAIGLCFQGLFYAVSGYATNSQGQFFPTAEVYNPATNSWTVMDGTWDHTGPFAVMFGKLYAVRGESLCSYDAATGAWSVVESILPVNPVCAAVVDDALLVTGPSNRSSEECGTFLYRPSKRCKWESVNSGQEGFGGVAHFAHAIEI
jgi:hypothetical protein